MLYEFPEELDFFERGFGYSEEYDRDEGIFSFVLPYENGDKLIFSHSPSGKNWVEVKLVQDDIVLFNIQKEGISNIAFQAWGNEKVIRVYCVGEAAGIDFLICYKPIPRLVYLER
ncbi:hypothetical protein [Vibrio marisflavi]|uniref:Uncharacterized protein n=1 Tax=Vibrio marisflavi CECT 7928 TaxID=634439 RepID=A0ABM9A6I9_9VIBR|nr:hypothetical protein [Vibrio marisflavi]CAH0540921.1 hypothetical protein VMF7928_03235 [Vibrio marisflavi CECT 7928]